MKIKAKITDIITTIKLEDWIMFLYLSIYTVISSLTLTLFPSIHSDETWLGSLSYAMYQSKSLFTTEPFFDLFPRTPHTMKILFHSIQILFIQFFGLSVFSIRLISLVFSLLTLIIFYKLLKTILQTPINALLITILLSVSSPFLYASHFARQEIILVFVLVLVYYLYTLNYSYNKFLIPILIGITINIHPNAFIIACMIGFILLKDTILKSKKLIDLVIYGVSLAIFAAGNIIVSLIQTPTFIKDYLAYGKTLDVTATPNTRLTNFKDFYIKCYDQISGTYYIPPMKLILAGGFVLLIIGLLLLLRKYKDQVQYLHLANSILMLLGYNLGLYIIGRYNTTSIIFILIPIVLLFALVLQIFLDLMPKQKKTISIIAISLLILVFTNSTYQEMYQLENYNYESYTKEIQSAISNDSIILGNLSSAFVFKDLAFLDIRNLEYLDKESVYDYLKANHINTLIYYEEYDYIHRNQNWEILYGNDEAYYDELNSIISDYGRLLYEFEDMYYGTRIIRYMGEYPWKISIYHLDL